MPSKYSWKTYTLKFIYLYKFYGEILTIKKKKKKKLMYNKYKEDVINIIQKYWSKF